MDKEIKSKWIEALRSGEYKRCHGQLHLAGGFNLFGVLCDLHAKETGGVWELANGSKTDYRYLGCCFKLPAEVTKWAGIKLDNRGHLVLWNGKQEPDNKDFNLNNMDIKAATFAEMADTLEAFA